MDLRHLKTILIFMLLFVLTSAVISYARAEQDDKNIDREYENRVVSMLYDNSISIDRAVIPRNGDTAENLYAEFIDCESDEFLTAALGEGCNLSDGVYTKDGKSVTLTDGGAVYTMPAPADGFAAESLFEPVLTALGVDLKQYRLSADGQSEDGARFVRYTAYFKDCEIFDSYIEVGISADAVTVTFKNPIKSCVKSDGRCAVFSGAGILAELPSVLRESGGLPASVTGVTLGAGADSGGRNLRSAFLIPVWRVSTDNADELYFDARNGKLLSRN